MSRQVGAPRGRKVRFRVQVSTLETIGGPCFLPAALLSDNAEGETGAMEPANSKDALLRDLP